MTSGSFFSFIRLAYRRVHPANCQQDQTTRKISDLDSIPTAVLLRFASFRPLRPFSFGPGQVSFLFGRFFPPSFTRGYIWCIVTTLRNNALHNVYTTSHEQQQRKNFCSSPTRPLFLFFQHPCIIIWREFNMSWVNCSDRKKNQFLSYGSRRPSSVMYKVPTSLLLYLLLIQCKCATRQIW